MRIYFVYKIDKNKRDESMIRPILYGYTTDKKVIKRFKKERNMKLFRIIEKELDHDGLMMFEQTNRYQAIAIRKYITYPKDEYGYRKDYIEIASTEYEEEQTYVWSDVALLEAGKYTKYPEYIFNKDLFKALHTLEYITIREYSHADEYDMMYPRIRVGKNTLPNISIDMFWIFMFLFGYTMNKDL